MAKKSTQYVCDYCGAEYAKWAGRCDNCGKWNTIVQIAIESVPTSKSLPLSPHSVEKIITTAAKKQRLRTQQPDLDQLLGGGFVEGSVVLIAGEPGIGKSTLLLQIATAISSDQDVLYVSGEESSEQIALRAKRLKLPSGKLSLVSSNSADSISATLQKSRYGFVVVDSIQTLSSDSVSSAPGSVSQIISSLALLSRRAKASKTTLVVVGHVTKDGSIAGPKMLEHLVDVVLYFEGDRSGGFRVLRSDKNRYGSTHDTAIYEMTENGMTAVGNPSAAFLKEHRPSDGSVVFASMQGSRPLLVEVQALVTTSYFGFPKRAASGIDLNRLNLLVAVLSRRTKLRLGDKDIYLNVVGGIRIADPAADLAVCLAIASAAKGMIVEKDSVVFGEVGLGGEVRHVSFLQKRLQEASKLGFSNVIGPTQLAKSKAYNSVETVTEAISKFLVKKVTK